MRAAELASSIPFAIASTLAASSLSKPSLFTSFKTSSAICPTGTLDGAFNLSAPLSALALPSAAGSAADDDAGVCFPLILDLDRAG